VRRSVCVRSCVCLREPAVASLRARLCVPYLRAVFSSLRVRMVMARPGVQAAGRRTISNPKRIVLSAEFMYVSSGPNNIAVWSRGIVENTLLASPYSVKQAIVVSAHYAFSVSLPAADIRF